MGHRPHIGVRGQRRLRGPAAKRVPPGRRCRRGLRRGHRQPHRRFSQRRAAAQDAKLIAGTYDVDNQLKVSLIGADRRDDDEIRGAALQNLVWDVEVPSDFVDVKVHDGWVTLKGDVSYQFESDAAYDDVAGLYGVLGVTNEITVSNP